MSKVYCKNELELCSVEYFWSGVIEIRDKRYKSLCTGTNIFLVVSMIWLSYTDKLYIKMMRYPWEIYWNHHHQHFLTFPACMYLNPTFKRRSRIKIFCKFLSGMSLSQKINEDIFFCQAQSQEVHSFLPILGLSKNYYSHLFMLRRNVSLFSEQIFSYTKNGW